MVGVTGMTAGGGQAVRMISLNTGGLNASVKRTKIMTHIKSLNADIMFIQETHLCDTDQRKLNRPWIGQIFHSKFNLKTRGAAILIKRNVQFTSTSITSDPNGRFIIVSGVLYQKPVVLVSVYAPNWDDHNFFKLLLSNIPNLNSHLLVLGGDLNCVMDPKCDRSSSRPMTPSKSAQTLSTFMDQFGYVDPWRSLHPLARQYSFFSHRHRSFSRIDYFIIDKTVLPSVISVQYSPITVSDHSTVIMDLHFDSKPKGFKFWRLDPLLLADAAFCSYVSESITYFCETNQNAETSASLLWETLKAFLRGRIISYTSHANKTRRTRQRELEESIFDLDGLLSSSPTADLYKERLMLQTELNLLLTRDAERLLLHSRGAMYEHGDKAGRLLAHQLKARMASNQISQIQDEMGTPTSDPVEINNIFRTYYSRLYTSESSNEEAGSVQFLDQLETPKISTNDQQTLDAPPRLSEIKNAIQLMNSGKSPGPDGYPVEFYKKFLDQLAPLLLSMFDESHQQGSLPPTLMQASISLISKKGKDPLSCASYRPISLLSVDAKILAKLFACRLESIVPSVISEDQTGFIKGRHSFTNIRRLLSVIHTPSSQTDPEAIIALDAEKAFDRVEWGYLFSSLQKFGFGTNLISWIKLLYSSPQASVCTNTQRSKPFPLFRGTRQGCPLSPLLFAIAIEPLAIALRAEKGFNGILRGGMEHRVSLYADDLLLYVRDPLSSIPHILSLLESFGRTSGYKLNIRKSECFLINQKAKELPASSIPFRIANSGFKYLGITITRSFSALREQNLGTLTATVKQDLKRWNLLPLSLTGRVQTVKMNILPRYLYIFQCLPIFLPLSFFNSINSMISSFIWAGKHARAGRTLLQRDRSQGGLGLPDLMGYYWAANVHKILLWFISPQSGWCQVENDSCLSSSPQALACSVLPFSPSRFTSNPVIIGSLRIWAQVRRRFGWLTLSRATPLCKNHLFLPANMDPRFTFFERKGLRCIQDLYIDGVFASFNQLRAAFGLCGSDFFRYFQLRDFAKTHSSSFPQTLPSGGVDLILEARDLTRSHVSYFYNLFSVTEETSINKIKADWEGELQLTLSDDFWEGALQAVNASSSCARLSLIQFKVLHRLHYSKAKLSRFYPDKHNDQCERCSQAPCNLAHMFWSCPRLTSFWESFFNTISKILKIDIHPSPHIAIFGRPPDGVTLTAMQTNVIAFASLIARRKILFLWKSAHPPLFKVWLTDVMFLLKLERIKFTLRGSSNRFDSHWRPLIEYVEQLPADEISPE